MKNTFGMDDAVIPIFFPSSLVRWLETQGYGRQALIENTDLELQEIDVPEVLVTFRQHRTLIGNALRLTADPHLGLYFGLQLQITAMGIVGYAAISSENLLEGLETILKYMKIRAPLINMEIEIVGEDCHIIYREALDYGPIRQFMYEAILGASMGMFSSLSILPPPGIIVKLTYPKPHDWEQHQQNIEYEVLFNQEICEFILPTHYLEQPSKLADPVTAHSAKKICDEQLKHVEQLEGLINRITALIHSSENFFPSLAETADALCISPRTLRRELQKQDTTYQTLLDQTRAKTAIKLLKNSNFTIQTIATKMGYNDSANFGRAFRKWTGKSPGSYRH